MASSSSTLPSAAISTPSAYSAAREPLLDEWDTLHSLADILAWAKLKGSVAYAPSQAGSLLAALGAEADTSVEEFAAIPEDTFLHIIREVWHYSASEVLEDGFDTDLGIKPSAIKLGHAVSAHYVARIWSGVESTRAHKIRRTTAQDTAASEYRDAKLKALQANAVAQATPASVHTVPINEVADTTQKREVPVMSPETYHKWYKNFKK